MNDPEIDQSTNLIPIRRAEGNTDSERYLKRLCDRTFLSLWSYSSVFRDQGGGKEVCDLLVVFENHIIIFSDKDCKMPFDGDLEVEWGRWYRRAVEASARQVWGAERWIRQHPNRIFLDPECKQPFPIKLPDPQHTVFHRIVIAHGAAEPCKMELGGSGSLAIVPRIIGSMHYKSNDTAIRPFAVGQVNPENGFVHVLDDTTFDLVLGTLDTVSDFVKYLAQKEEFVASGRLEEAAGEDELLAFYMLNWGKDGAKGFSLPAGAPPLRLDAGGWARFARHPRRRAQQEANRISYFWDGLIELFNVHLLSGSQYYANRTSISEQEQGLRLLARENRTRRRILSKHFFDMLEKTDEGIRRKRTVRSLRAGDPYYVFLLLPMLPSHSYEENRGARRQLLLEYCMVAKVECPDAEDIIGIATETRRGLVGSEDFAYLDARGWTEDHQAEALRMQRELRSEGLLGTGTTSHSIEHEFPFPRSGTHANRLQQAVSFKGRDRNKPCPCGSRRKYKRCCGAVGRT